MFQRFYGGSSNQNAAEPISEPLINNQDEDIEYLYIDENPFMKVTDRPTGSFGPLPMRTVYDKICYGTGAVYLLGLTSGGTYGFVRGIRRAAGTTFKLRLNSVLNTVTRYGPWAANSMGVMSNYIKN
jgi:import inner membrane translocase subunit TIM23